MKNFKWIFIAGCSVWLTACGGGSGSKQHSPDPVLTYTVTASAGQNGSVSPAQASVSQNQNTVFTFAPNSHYHLKTVAGCGGTLAGNAYTTAAITANCAVIAEFELDKHSVTVNASANGTYLVQNSMVNHGDAGKIIVSPNTGYALESFSGCGVGTVDGNIYTTAPVTGDCSVTITFKKVATIQGTAAEGAAITNASVIAKCADGTGFTAKVLTESSGHFIGQVGESAFPCALSVTAINPARSYYSVVQQAGTANITPLTDIILAIASNQKSADWFASANWQNAISQIENVQASLKDILENKNYRIPQQAFSPINTAFTIGDTWDQLLDQLNTARSYLTGKSYDEFATAVTLGNSANIPSPSGSFEETAEACFNPELYAEGVSYTFREVMPTQFSEGSIINYGYDFTYTYTNQKIRDEDGVPILTANYSDIWKSDDLGAGYFVPSYAAGERKQVVDFENKIVKNLSLYYILRDENQKSLSDRLSTFERTIEFNTAKGVEKTYAYAGVESGRDYENDVRFEQTTSYEVKRTFTGITKIERFGSLHKVCQFDVKEKRTYQDFLGNPATNENSYSEYYLVGSGVNVSSQYLISVLLNGKQL